jgi:hypothetical protein
MACLCKGREKKSSFGVLGCRLLSVRIAHDDDDRSTILETRTRGCDLRMGREEIRRRGCPEFGREGLRKGDARTLSLSPFEMLHV